MVSAVLRGSKAHVRYSPETEARVLAAARALGYRRHPASTALRTGRTHVMGLYLGDAPALFRHPHSAYALSVMQQALAARGYSLQIVPLDRPNGCDFRQMDGLILMDFRPEDAATIRQAAQSVPTFAWHGSAVPDDSGVLKADSAFAREVTRTNHELAARYLYELGHRRIGLVEPWGAKGDKQGAEAVFKRIAKDRGLRVELHAVFDYLAPRMYPSAMKFLDREVLPTAFYALDDEVAHRIIEKLTWRNLTVPRDVAVFSRQTDETRQDVSSGITGIYTDWPVCWRSLVNQFLDVVEGKGGAGAIRAVIPGQRVIERTTCAPVQA